MQFVCVGRIVGMALAHWKITRREFGLDPVGGVEPLEGFVQGNDGMFVDCKLSRLVHSLGKCSEIIGSQR